MKYRYGIYLLVFLMVTTLSACGLGDSGFFIYRIPGPEQEPSDTDPGQSLDADGDGFPDLQDNCPAVANSDQADLDSDATGDLCDADIDGDGKANASDAFPMDASEWSDYDGDGIGDNADTSGKDGLYWVSTDGDDVSGFGTVDFPFRTIAKAVAASISEGGTKDVHVVGGTYPETVILGNADGYHGIAIRGGYGSLDVETNTRSRNIEANQTSVDGVVVDGSAGLPLNDLEAVIEGFSVSRLSIIDASPEVKNNSIVYRIESCEGGAAVTIESTGINSSSPKFHQNHIENVDCLYDEFSFASVAIEITASDQSMLRPEFKENQVAAGGGVNPADMALGILARASGLSILEPSLISNSVSTGQALLYAAAVNMWADSIDSQATLVAEGNDIRAGSAPLAYAIDLGYNSVSDFYAEFGSADIQRNRIFGGTDCETSAALSIVNASDVSKVVNNFISGGNSTADFAFLEGIVMDNANADIISNTIVANSSDTAFLIDMLSATASTRIENNVFYASGFQVVGIAEAWDSEPASVESNLFDLSVETVYLSNTWGDIFDEFDLEFAYPAYTPNYVGLALLADPMNMDLHIDEFSDARDAGSSANAPAVDLDGDARPSGFDFDIGADEYHEAG